MAARRDQLRMLAGRTRDVVLAAAVVGVVTGLAVAGFERLTIDGVFDRVSELPLWLLAFMPMVGLGVATLWLRYPGRGTTPDTADAYLQAFHAGGELPARPAAHRLVACLATLGTGGALGLEGPSIYLGATIGSQTQRRFRRFFRGTDRNLLLVAGAAAGIAAIFKAPATGAVFAIEVPYQDDLARRMLLPALVAGASGYLGLAAIDGTAPLFAVHGSPSFTFADLAGAAVLGLLAGVGARLFARLLRGAKRVSRRVPPLVRVLGAGLALAGLFAACRGLTGESLTISPGYSVVAWTTDPSNSVWVVLAVLVLRCLATSATVAGGGAGGLFVPLVVAGALLGRAMEGVLDDHTTLFIVVGVAAFLGAGYRVPLAAVMFVAETTGRPAFVVPGLIAAVVGELMMGRASVTAYQMAPQPGAPMPAEGRDPSAGDEEPDTGGGS
jgi:CIC family chloride channel protein